MLSDYRTRKDPGQALVMCILSTGMHPSVLSRPDDFALDITPDYYSYMRPKTLKPVSHPWSRLMASTDGWLTIKDLLGSHRSWYHAECARIGSEAGIPFKVGPNMLRHEMFSNLARIGYDPFTISHRAGTSLDTIGRYYTVGMADAKRLTPTELAFLQELMDP